MIRIVYVANNDADTLSAAKAAGFDGYIHSRRALINAESLEYWDEPEDNPDAYLAWIAQYPWSSRFVTYGNPKKAKKVGAWHSHGVMGYISYPFTSSRNLWMWFVTFPWNVWKFKGMVFDEPRIVGVIQAFGASTWVVPKPWQIRWQERVWRWVFGDRLYAIAYFMWDFYELGGYGIADPLKEHPELWPVNL